MSTGFRSFFSTKGIRARVLLHCTSTFAAAYGLYFWKPWAAGLALGVGLLTLWWNLEKWIQNLAGLARTAQAMADDGNLSRRAVGAGGDEIGRAVAAFNAVVERFETVPRVLEMSVGMLSEALDDVEGAVTSQDQWVVRQAAALVQAQVAGEEIKRIAQTASERATRALEAAEKARKLAGEGESASVRTMDGLASIQAEVLRMSEKIGQLEQRSQQILTVTETVKELADQSNVLALNAAIEAIRAGNQGKGFGLVAREMRRLADQSIQSTYRVREILEGLRKETGEAVRIAKQGAGEVERALGEVRHGGEQFRALSEVVKENSLQVGEISNVVRQQSQGIQQMSETVAMQSKMMEETSERVEKTRGAHQTLRLAAGAVQAIVKQFKG